MTSNWQSVSTGLRLALFGAKTVAWSVTAGLCLSCGGAAVLSASNASGAAGCFGVILLFVSLMTAVVGRVLCAVGRWMCVAVPPEAEKVRTRIRLACILETCSLLSGTATIAVNAVGSLIPNEIHWSSAAFWAITTVSWRICFFDFARSASEYIGSEALAQHVKSVIQICLITLIASIVGAVLASVGTRLPEQSSILRDLLVIVFFVGWILIVIAISLALYLFACHFILSTQLLQVLAHYKPVESNNDPDREYRKRHIGNSDTDEE